MKVYLKKGGKYLSRQLLRKFWGEREKERICIWTSSMKKCINKSFFSLLFELEKCQGNKRNRIYKGNEM